MRDDDENSCCLFCGMVQRGQFVSFTGKDDKGDNNNDDDDDDDDDAAQVVVDEFGLDCAVCLS